MFLVPQRFIVRRVALVDVTKGVAPRDMAAAEDQRIAR